MNHPRGSIILCFVFCVVQFPRNGVAFSPIHPVLPRFRKPSITARQNWLGDLWEEVVEFSTYGPSERKILKAKREQAAAEARRNNDDVSMDSFQRAQEKFGSKTSEGKSSESSLVEVEEDSLSLQAFQAAVASSSGQKNGDDQEEIDFDGYKLRDLLVDKFGAALDVDFQRGMRGESVYCTVVPVAFGSSRCRHKSELDYLMHLQGVVEILKKYNNLDDFLFFLKKTDKVPKPGVESAPYLMKLDEEALKKIL